MNENLNQSEFLLFTLEGHKNRVYTVVIWTFIEGFYFILSGSEDCTIKLWDTYHKKCDLTLKKHNETITSIALSPYNEYFISGAVENLMLVWKVDTNKLVKRIKAKKVICLAVSPDGKYFVAGTYENTIEVRTFPKGELIKEIRGHEKIVRSVTISPDGKYIISGSLDNTIKKWSFFTGNHILTIKGHNKGVRSVNITPDGNYIISGSNDKTIKIWSLATGELIRVLEGHNEKISSTAISYDGKYIISGSLDKTLKIWEFSNGNLVNTLEGHEDYVFSVAISDDNNLLVSGSADHTLKVWDFKRIIGLYQIKLKKMKIAKLERVKRIKEQNSIILAKAQVLFDNRQWEDAISLYKSSKEICIKQGWTDKIESIQNMILKCNENKENEIEEKEKKRREIAKRERERKERIKKAKVRNEAIQRIKKLPNIYEEISLNELNMKITIGFDELKALLEELIKNGDINAKIRGNYLVFKEREKIQVSPQKLLEITKKSIKIVRPSEISSQKINVLRGGDWKIEKNQSIFYFKVKVRNNSKYVLTNIQILLTSIPPGLLPQSDRYRIDTLNPDSFESPQFKFTAKDSCVGDFIKGMVIFTDQMGNQQTITIKPFRIEYVCNLLVPKSITKENYRINTASMQERKIIFDCDLEPDKLESEVAQILDRNNFFILENPNKIDKPDFRKIRAYAEGKYDKQDVALSVIMQGLADHTNKLIIKAMSNKEEKIIDLLRDISMKCDVLKSTPEDLASREVMCKNCESVIIVTDSMESKDFIICEDCGEEIEIPK